MSTLTDIYEEIERCQNCELAKRRTRVVPGEGPEKASLLFIVTNSPRIGMCAYTGDEDEFYEKKFSPKI